MTVKELKKAIKFLPDENEVLIELPCEWGPFGEFDLVTSEGQIVGEVKGLEEPCML